MSHAEVLGEILDITGVIDIEKRALIDALLEKYEKHMEETVLRVLNADTCSMLKIGFELGRGV